MVRKASEPAEGRRRSTIREVADRAGVSVATVSRILTGSYPASPATRKRVLRAVEELDYVANAHARALAGASSKSVAMALNSVISPHYAHVAQGVETQAAAEGRLCLIGTTGGDPERELAMVKFMLEQHTEAVILVGNVVIDERYRERMSQYAHSLSGIGSRLVLCGRPSLGPDVPAIVVDYDNAGGAFAATSHLLSAGHRRILCLGSRPGYTTADGRLAGYRRALEAHHVPHDPALEVEGTMEWHEGYRMMRERLAAGPRDFTAVFAVNDLIAGGAHKALTEHGLKVPDDVSMVGFDDLPPSNDLDLTTVHLPHEEIGRTAVRLALEHEARGG
ncbi:LacI family DNA-binding transcriptional regulator [Actinosynnema sp. NPDC023658]|uniref:LacI family DNA-binding transcriptional regulator n=1 Tax=Actinosynnema sp. NPDC023658 TaxID=3155465 RepID=UPI0033DE94C0